MNNLEQNILDLKEENQELSRENMRMSLQILNMKQKNHSEKSNSFNLTRNALSEK